MDEARIEASLEEALALRDSGRVLDALEGFQRLQEPTADPEKKAVLLLNEVTCYMILERFGDARQRLDEASRKIPADSALWLSVEYTDACLMKEEGKPEEALDKLEKLLSCNPGLSRDQERSYLYEEIQQRRAALLYQLGENEKVIPLLEEVLSFEMSPGDRSRNLCILACCCRTLHRYERAKELYLEAREIGVPENWEGRVHWDLGITHYHLREFGKAKQEFLLCERGIAGYGIPVFDLYGWLSATCSALGEKIEAARYAQLSKPS